MGAKPYTALATPQYFDLTLFKSVVFVVSGGCALRLEACTLGLLIALIFRPNLYQPVLRALANTRRETALRCSWKDMPFAVQEWTVFLASSCVNTNEQTG